MGPGFRRNDPLALSARKLMHETAYAKLNLALHVRERMPDGYHRIETIFAFAEDGDRLAVAQGEALELDVSGPFAADLEGESGRIGPPTAQPGGLCGSNLVLRAAQALRERYGVRQGARLTLDKRLPIASGIGGGSADAAAALRLLTRFWALEADEAALLDIAASLGADVPACLFSRPARGEGKGDDLRPLSDENLSGMPVLLVNPRVKLSTADVFRAWDGIDRGALASWREGRNDLQPAAIALVPEIAEVLAALDGAGFARMSGSGATCFGLYAGVEARDADAAGIKAAHPGWWTLATRLR